MPSVQKTGKWAGICPENWTGRILLEQAIGERVFQVGQDERSMTLAYALKGSVRGKRKVAELIGLAGRLNGG